MHKRHCDGQLADIALHHGNPSSKYKHARPLPRKPMGTKSGRHHGMSLLFTRGSGVICGGLKALADREVLIARVARFLNVTIALSTA
eukprot:scaffold70219_cov17-Tisochrysis_lutea.AAC.1